MRHDNRYYRFLTSVLRGTTPEGREWLSPGWRWDELIRIASDETILPPLSFGLKQLGLWDQLPLQTTDFLEAYTELNALRNRQLYSEIEGAAISLNAAGIEPLVLKGPAYILGGAYPDPAHRFNLDIDLLVPKSQVEQTFLILRGAGYAPAVEDPLARASHHLPALVQEDKIRIELHNELGTRRCRQLLPAEEIYGRSHRLPLGAAAVRIPCPTDLIAHLIVHSQIHHGAEQRMWPPLRVQYDLFVLARHYGSAIDWADIRDRFERHGYRRVLEMHLLQIADTLRYIPPIPIRRGFSTRLHWAHRRALWRLPELRFVDPSVFLSAATNIRPSMSEVLRMEGGMRYLLTRRFAGRVYQKLVNSFRY